eukprot:CAMPEP_0176058452 /NCGR_PEP_ID=MMETSP0120_2-20121206/29123_1 /TAXON_ID=160619 /ORGANISM="Kryptoperidinium foliaceum, Strain CCMP 1326" /LENGTH=355 /DNA_ID=CAMNT_0017391979 /DNA_START=72 /DNA_END=1137 /DNA_ORIENTATION=+
MGPPESGVSAPPERAPGADGPSPTGEQEPWRPPPLRSASHPTQPPSRALRGLRRRRLPAPGFEVALLATDSALLVPRRALADRVVCAATAVAELAHRALSDGVVRTAAIEAVARALLALLLGLGLRAVRLAADLTEMALLTADATLLVDEAAVRLGMAGGAATETDVIRLRDLRLGLRLRLRFRLRLLAARTGVVAHNLQVADLATDRTLLVFELAILLCMARLAAATTRLRPRPIGGVRLTAHRHQVAQLAEMLQPLSLFLQSFFSCPVFPQHLHQTSSAQACSACLQAACKWPTLPQMLQAFSTNLHSFFLWPHFPQQVHHTSAMALDRLAATVPRAAALPIAGAKLSAKWLE